METKFTSQICTSREQSERLLALGLKKETADMHWTLHSVTQTWYVVAHSEDGVGKTIPAWSLHRLIEISKNSRYHKVTFMFDRDLYNDMITAIEFLIRGGSFNKEYLANQTEIEEHCKGVLEYLNYIKEEEE